MVHRLQWRGEIDLAHEVERRLIDSGQACYALDGDNVRHGLNRDLGFSARERRENVRRVAEVAKLFNDAGMIVVVALISPYRHDREMPLAPRSVPTASWSPLEHRARRVRAARPQGRVRPGPRGRHPQFTGISAPYEPPYAPALALDTATMHVDVCAERVISLLAAHLG